MQPLHGVTILDLTRLLPGPYCAWLLHSWGARVIKVEEPTRGDYMRELLPLWFEHMAAGVESIGLDLSRPEGRSLFLDLVERADMVLEGFRPGVMERLGLSHDVLAERNPRIVLVSISGFHAHGPDAHRPGHDLGYLARSGLLSLLDGPPAFQLGDLSAGLVAATGGLAALVAARATGRGSRVEVSLTDCLKALGGFHALEALAGRLQPREKMLLGGHQPCYRLYETKGGGRVALAALETKFWTRFCEVVGHPEWIPRQLDASLVEEIQALFASRPLADWAELSRREPECCLEPVVGIEGAMRERREVQPVCFDGERPISEGPVPRLGEHTERVLREWGVPEEQIRALFAEGVAVGQR